MTRDSDQIAVGFAGSYGALWDRRRRRNLKKKSEYGSIALLRRLGRDGGPNQRRRVGGPFGYGRDASISVG